MSLEGRRQYRIPLVEILLKDRTSVYLIVYRDLKKTRPKIFLPVYT